MKRAGYRSAMEAAKKRLADNSKIVKTKLGEIEYSEFGEGQPVLVIHGAGGGFDQGSLCAEAFIGSGFHFISVSRFGYLRTPVPKEATAAAMSDLCASLLDELNIPRAAVVGISDGGPTTLQFAMRHSERCSALVMMCAKSHSPVPETVLQKIVFDTIFRSNYLFWYLTYKFKPFLSMMFGIPKELQDKLTPEDIKFIDDTIECMHPMYMRKKGIYNDRKHLTILPPEDYPLHTISVPTLVVHAADDPLQPISHGQNAADKIPGARLMKLPYGGHLLSLHLSEIRSVVSGFLSEVGSLGKPEEKS